MSVLVFVEEEEGEIKKSGPEAVSYASATGKIIGDDEVIALVMGDISEDKLAALGAYGASKVVNIVDEQLNQHQIGAYAQVLSGQVQKLHPGVVVFSKSAFADNVAARLAGKTGASIVSNVVSLPEVDGTDLVLRKGIFTGKAFNKVKVSGDTKIIIARKNSVEIHETGSAANVEKQDLPDGVMFTENVTGREKAEGDILLDEAEVVVSGGRGLKGPENWGMIEELAAALGAATGCSKPVSDMGWRPHHEHVGQTGVKISPNLYIAVGISGAIQHLAGVNSSKVLVAINNDPEAPFFKAADYGIVGDAFEVIPKLTEKIKSL